MIELLYKSGDFEDKFIECMKKYRYYYWATGWSGNGFRAYELLLQEEYKSKIKVFVTGVYDIEGMTKTTKEFMRDFKDVEGVEFIGSVSNNKGKNPLHSKEYLFFTDEFQWEAFIGSANFTKAGFTKNYEAILHFNQDSGDIKEIMPFFEDELPKYEKLSKKKVNKLSQE